MAEEALFIPCTETAPRLLPSYAAYRRRSLECGHSLNNNARTQGRAKLRAGAGPPCAPAALARWATQISVIDTALNGRRMLLGRFAVGGVCGLSRLCVPRLDLSPDL